MSGGLNPKSKASATNENYYLNYLKMGSDSSYASSSSPDEHNPNNTSTSHNEDYDQSSVEDYSNLDTSNDGTASAILPPPSFLGRKTSNKSADLSISYESSYDDSASESDSVNKGSYLSMDASGKVVTIRPNNNNTNNDDASISSAPRTALPSHDASAPISLLGSRGDDDAQDEDDEDANDTLQDISYLLEPPDASDYALADATTHTTTIIPTNPEEPENSYSNNKLPVLTPSEHDQLRTEEESEASKVLQGTVESPPPVQPPLPADHFSHLLKDYELEQDPSIPPLPPPFVMSPTDEKRSDAHSHNRGGGSPNTSCSYEDDIEQQQQPEPEPEPVVPQSSEDRFKNRRKGAVAGLFSIFSPRQTTSNNEEASDKDHTPDTDHSSPLASEPTTASTNTLKGRKLFGSSKKPPKDDASEDCSSAVTGEHYNPHRKAAEAARAERLRKKRKLWMVLGCLFVTVLILAVAIIAYAMHAASQTTLEQGGIDSASSSEAVIDLAANNNGNTNEPDTGSIVIAVSNQTDSDNAFDLPELRPVTPKNPTETPTLGPTPRPTISPQPTAAPEPTAAPTAEVDFVTRLQALIETSINVNSGVNNMNDNDNVFEFDFSGTDALTDPNNQALVYLAREVAAVQGVDRSSSSNNAASDGLGNVVVTTGDQPLPQADPNFIPIHIKTYDDDKLLQRFALLSMQFAAFPPAALVTDEYQDPFTAAVAPQESDVSAVSLVTAPSKRIVLTEQALAEAIESGTPETEQDTTQSVDPSTLYDPSDARFLVDECDWDGVQCVSNADATATIVTKVRWDFKALGGSIAPSLGLLTALTHLDMSNNELVGTIPDELYQLTNLEELYLFKNWLTGTISSTIGDLDVLRRVHLSHNYLTGSLPSQLKSDGGSVDGIRPIEYFNVYSNELTGTIPQELRWRRCTTLDLGNNRFEGTLPADLGDKFVSLRHLFLDHNYFSGTLPESYNTVGNGRLVMLSIESNELTGIVPGPRDKYDTLVTYTLHDNYFDWLEPQNCQNHLLVEFKADCEICTCFGRFFDFCERWCGYNRPPRPAQQQQRQDDRPPSQEWQPPRNNNFSF